MDKKIEETREFLQTIGMPKAQLADICCYVILAMAGIKPDMSWSEATNEWIRIHDIIQFVNTFYGMSYAENSRERVVGNNKMKLLYGTGNLAKLSAMRNRLEQLDIELIGLNDLRVEGKNVPEVKEDGNTPLENARLKAMAYYEAFQIPVFSCDSGLYFDNVPNEVQPGVHVRNVNGKCLSDDEMIDYYSGLVKAYGNLVARYRNAICFVMDNTHIYEAMEPSMESEKFILTDKPHSTVRKEGFPLDSISLDIKTNKYYYDLPEDKLEQVAVEDGFLEFFKNILNLN